MIQKGTVQVNQNTNLEISIQVVEAFPFSVTLDLPITKVNVFGTAVVVPSVRNGVDVVVNDSSEKNVQEIKEKVQDRIQDDLQKTKPRKLYWIEGI